jgi:hypothetical protein
MPKKGIDAFFANGGGNRDKLDELLRAMRSILTPSSTPLGVKNSVAIYR